jgi:hypothetical protein
MQGAQLQADVYRQAGQVAQLSSNYDAAVNNLKSSYTEDNIGRQMTDMLSKNDALAASNGLSLSSKSAFLINNDILASSEKQMAINRASTAQQNSMTLFEGNLQSMADENQARAAIYSGELQQTEYENQAKATQYQGDVDVYELMMENPETFMNKGSGVAEQGILGAAQGAILGLGI